MDLNRFYHRRKVLVTGAGGFIGSHLAEAAARAGADVTAMIRYSSSPAWGNLEHLSPDLKSSIRVVAGNIEDPEFVSQTVQGQDIVFHLAALIAIPYSYVAPRSYVRTNIEGTLKIEPTRRGTSDIETIIGDTARLRQLGVVIPPPDVDAILREMLSVAMVENGG
ncbi:GDP-mannose 4,6-dehydratase [Bradyrhizobium sp. Ai1a-2]|uniref:GDP-mannose 4,6-dehydratase n=1 Tax=Bradyrhizobium sp. Ai1a-2 TaxID=196490 RepID=UPI0009FFF9F2|nr:GDP-mannose 4,6-dehydratase [Bradyrhizobium sp. Ai1a-2]